MNRLLLFIFLIIRFTTFAQDNSDCLTCHDDKTAKSTRRGKTISIFVDEKKLKGSVHIKNKCIDCHIDLKDADFPHPEAKRAQCGKCHEDAQKAYSDGLHGKAKSKGDPLAPACVDCHGNHDILKKTDPRSATFPLKVPYLCGRCHREGAPVQVQRNIPQDHILENYSESIHGEGLLKKGLTVSATCASCHTPHLVLPHTDPRSSIARKNIAATCIKCHMGIENVHRKIIKGELWEKEAHVLPACVDCHQPHKARKVFYDQGMADSDCLSCHGKKNIKNSKAGHSMFVDTTELKDSKHIKIACSQCHSQVNPSKVRPCETITSNVDCASCHAAVGEDYKISTHGKLFAKKDPDAPFCAGCHGTHHVLGKQDKRSPTFATNIPKLCAECHGAGKAAAKRIKNSGHDVIKEYEESIHGRGLMKSGLTVTAKCTDCHSAHRELPSSDPKSTTNPDNISATCGVCHSGIKEKFDKSVHSPFVTKTDKKLPVCNDCHAPHTTGRTDVDAFKLGITASCGKCHAESVESYLNTYHGKVSELGYTKTANCYDCHGAHDILSVTNPDSHLSRQNIIQTCQKCHETATKMFAGYLSHATHHDSKKYPILFFVFWGMTGLLVGTFLIAGAHTLLWLPRSFEWKKKIKEIEEKEKMEEYVESHPPVKSETEKSNSPESAKSEKEQDNV